MTITRFKDRIDAGRRLAVALDKYRDSDPIVLGLPRGGIPVASEVAAALHASLDVLIVRKLGVPNNRELAMGAIGEGGAIVVDHGIMDYAGVGQGDLERVIAEERAELDRRVLLYRQHRPMQPLAGRTVIVVDDGIATGSTARAALQVVRSQRPKRIILATVASPGGDLVRTRGHPARRAHHKRVDSVEPSSLPRLRVHPPDGTRGTHRTGLRARQSHRRRRAHPRPRAGGNIIGSSPAGAWSTCLDLAAPALSDRVYPDPAARQLFPLHPLHHLVP